MNIQPISLSIILSCLFMLICSNSMAADKAATDQQKWSYVIGFQIGQNLKNGGISNKQIDNKMLTQGIDDVLSGKDLQFSMEEMKTAFEKFQKKQQKKQQKKGSAAKKKGQDFLAANKKKKGIVALPNGLQYKVITKGKGEKPKPTDTITANYEGTLVDGTVFDSSYKRGQPATFAVNGVIKGWQEILPMMSIGSKWKVFIPSDLAYGERGAGGNIGPNETLIFDIELLSIKK